MTTEGETIGGKWKLCPACHLRVWLTKRGKMCKHIGEPSEHGSACDDVSVRAIRQLEADGVLDVSRRYVSNGGRIEGLCLRGPRP